MKTLSMLLLLLMTATSSLSFAGNEDGEGLAKKARCDLNIIKVINVAKNSSKVPALTAEETEAYAKFIKKNLRLPTAAEAAELELPAVADEYFFGNWGSVWPQTLARQELTEEENSSSSKKKTKNKSTKSKFDVLPSDLNSQYGSVESIFSQEQIADIIDAFYKKLRAWVKESNYYPPEYGVFAKYLGIEGRTAEVQFKKVFNRNTGLFRGYLESFREYSLAWGDLGAFLSDYVDVTTFNDEIKAQLIADLKNSPAVYVGGFVSGQPALSGLEDAIATLQKQSEKDYGTVIPMITAPSYGLAGGIPARLSAPKEHRYIVPQTVILQDRVGNAASINENPLPNRALIPQTGMQRMLSPGKLMTIVHPQSIFQPYPSEKKPSAVVTTGSLNKGGYNKSKRPIGARVSALQNELHSTQLLVLEKLTGKSDQLGMGLEAEFRPRALPFLDKEVSIVTPEGDTVIYPEGFGDLNKWYGKDGKVYDLPILEIVFGDTHAPVTDQAFMEAFYRQFINPSTCLKRTDGKPADIFAFSFNDNWNFDWASRWTRDDKRAQAHLTKDPYEMNLDLHIKAGLLPAKDLQYAMKQTRGYVPYTKYLHSNHDIDRLEQQLKSGDYVHDAQNAKFWSKLVQYKNEGSKNPLEDYMRNDIGVTYNDHTYFQGIGEKVAVSNLELAHGHVGGVFGKPVNAATRRAAVGSGIYGDTHVAMWNNGVYNAGHAVQALGYAKGWYNSGFQTVTIRTALFTQVLIFMDGTFYGAQTHGNPDFEFRDGYPLVKPLPVDTHDLPSTANRIDQYF